MQLLVEVICLFFTLFVVWCFMLTGTYSRAHRLLPLLLGIIAVFGFYMLVKDASHQFGTFHLLEDLLFVQVFYVLWAYILDYHDIKPPFAVAFLVVLYSFATDVVLYTIPIDGPLYWKVLMTYEIFFVCLISSSVLYARLNFRYSYEERMTSRHLLVSVAFPVLVLLVEDYQNKEHGMLMLSSLVFGVIILLYLILTGKIIDTRFFLNERVFQEAENPMLLFDHTFFLLGANAAALKIYPELKSGDHLYLRNIQAQDRMKQFIMNHQNERRITYQGRTYQFEFNELEYKKIPRGYIVVGYDVTENLEAIEEAKTQAKLKANFLARSSHDLRSPLHAIIGISEMLRQKPEIMGKNRMLVDNIQDSGNRLLKIVNSILDYSKMEAGALELQNEPYSIMESVREQSQIAIVNLRDKNVDFSMEICTEYPSQLAGDRIRVSEMMQNVISNAVKFTQEGSVKGKLSFHMEETRWKMEFAVTDTGGGIPEEKLKTIFDEYSSYADEKRVEGTGLGMSILKQLAILMGGDAYVESDGRTGTTTGFYIYQDIANEYELCQPELMDAYTLVLENAEGDHDIVPNYTYPKAAVLMADDMEINRMIFERATSGWNFQLDMVENGLQAVECVKKKKYDLIILDYMMPVMGGDEAVKHIREMTDTPVMLLSANVFDGNIQNYRSLGFSEILSKPLDAKQLINAIEGYLPEELREEVPEENKKELGQKQLEARIRTIYSFRRELERAVEELPKLLEENPDEYRIRVHGIKGAARQIGYQFLSIMSEIQEMAVQADHLPFIRENQEFYLANIQENIGDLDYEIKEMERRLKTMKTNALEPMDEEETKEPVQNVIQSICTALDAYDAVKAEEQIKILKTYSLSEEQMLVVDQIFTAINDFEYEQAIELIRGLQIDG